MTRTAVSLSLLLAIGCGTSPPPSLDLAPPASATSREIVGTYRFDGLDECVRSSGLTPREASLLPVDRIRPGSDVTLERRDGDLVFRFTNLEGNPEEVPVSLSEADWDGTQLTVRPELPARPAVFPGLAGQSRACDLYRADDGSLVIVERRTSAGLALFLVPFRDRNEMVIRLEAK